MGWLQTRVKGEKHTIRHLTIVGVIVLCGCGTNSAGDTPDSTGRWGGTDAAARQPLPESHQVDNVMARIRGLSHSGDPLKLRYITTEGIPTSEAEFPITNRGSNCHIQAVQRLGQHGAFVFAGNSAAPRRRQLNCADPQPGRGAHLFVARVTSKIVDANGRLGPLEAPSNGDGVTASVLLSEGMSEYFHPGGFQAVGSIVFAGFDNRQESIVEVWDVSDPTAPTRMRRLDPDLTQRHRALALGVVTGPHGEYLLAVQGNEGVVYFYLERDAGPRLVFDSAGVFDPGARSPGFRMQWQSYTGFNLVAETGGKFYLVGIDNDHGSVRCPSSESPRAFLEAAITPANTIVHVYELVGVDSRGRHLSPFDAKAITRTFLRVGSRMLASHYGAGCAGAGVYATPKGNLFIYLMKQWGVGGTVSVFEHAGSAPASPPEICRHYPAMFQDEFYRGRRLLLNRDVANLRKEGFGKKASSLCVPRGQWMRVYYKTRYRKQPLVLLGPSDSGSTANGIEQLGSRSRIRSSDWNDAILSVRVGRR